MADPHFDKIVRLDYTVEKHSHPIPHQFMSAEQLRSSEDPVVEALQLESEIARTLNHPVDATARKEVRRKMESWLQLLQDPTAAKLYQEELGELPVDVAKQDVLGQIGSRFPGVAKDFGWNPDTVNHHVDMAA